MQFVGPRSSKVSTQYWHFLLAHAGIGVAGMLLYAPATAIAGHWFLKRRSTAVGIAVSGSGLAGVVLPIMIKELIEALSESPQHIFARRVRLM